MKKGKFQISFLVVSLTIVAFLFGGTGQSIDEFELTNEVSMKLISDFGCNIVVNEETRTDKVVVIECLRDAKNEGNVFYSVDAHPVGTWEGTYIIYDGVNFTEVKQPSELKKFFTPINDESTALKYAYLSEGLRLVNSIASKPEVGETTVKKVGDHFEATILSSSRNMCPCYGSYSKKIYDIYSDGTLTQKSSELVYSYENEGCIC